MSDQLDFEKTKLKELLATQEQVVASLVDSDRKLAVLRKEIAFFEEQHNFAEQSYNELLILNENLTKENNSLVALNEKTKKEIQDAIDTEEREKQARKVKIFSEISNIESQKKDLLKQLADIKQSIDNHLTIINEATTAKKVADEKLRIVNQDLVESSKLLSELTVQEIELNEKCRVAQQKTSQAEVLLEEVTKKLSEAESEWKKITDAQIKLDKDRQEFSFVVESVNRHKKKLVTEAQKLENLYKELGRAVKLT
jgi:chromosome segregation ATPase